MAEEDLMSLHPDHANDAEYLHAKVSCLTWTFVSEIPGQKERQTSLK